MLSKDKQEEIIQHHQPSDSIGHEGLGSIKEEVPGQDVEERKNVGA